MLSLPITSTVAAILAITMLPLTILVSMRRVTLGKEAGNISKFAFGDVNDETFRRRFRALGNFTEYVPLALIMLALAEANGASTLLLAILGGLFAVGRIVHATAMINNPYNPVPRALAMFATYAIMGVPAIWLLYNFWGKGFF